MQCRVQALEPLGCRSRRHSGTRVGGVGNDLIHRHAQRAARIRAVKHAGKWLRNIVAILARIDPMESGGATAPLSAEISIGCADH